MGKDIAAEFHLNKAEITADDLAAYAARVTESAPVRMTSEHSVCAMGLPSGAPFAVAMIRTMESERQ